MSKSPFPAGWDEERAKSVIAHYDAAADEELALEDDKAADEQSNQTIVSVPRDLLPAIRTLIAAHQNSR